jgi:NADH-quinone oxidoreductase subunit M
MRFSEGLVIAPLLALIVFLGVYPTPVLDRIEPAVQQLIEHVDDEVEDFEEVQVDYVGPAEDAGSDGHGADEPAGEEHGAGADLDRVGVAAGGGAGR